LIDIEKALHIALADAAHRVSLAHAAVAFVWHGNVYIACHGTGADDRFYLASLSKALFAHVAVRCFNDLGLDAGQSLAEILPELQLPGGPPTLDRLLDMAVGLSESGASNFGLALEISAAERLRRMAFAERHSEGANKFTYHNGAYVAVCVAIERLTGKSAEDCFAFALHDISGCQSVSMIGKKDFVDVNPMVHTGKEFMPVPLIVGRNSLGSGGLGASISFMGNWVAANLKVDLPFMNSKTEPCYHRGWFYNPLGEVLTRRHTGSGPGYGHFCALLDHDKVGVVVLTSTHKCVAEAVTIQILNAFGYIQKGVLEIAIAGENGVFCNRVDLAKLAVTRSRDMAGIYYSPEAGLACIAERDSGLHISFPDCPSADGMIVQHPTRGDIIRPSHPAVYYDPDPAEIIGIDKVGESIILDHYGIFTQQ
jgi:hypothetical protein